MNIFGKSESSQRPKSTADLAAAARHSEATATDATADNLPVLSRERAKARDPAEARDVADAETSERAMASERADTPERMTARDRAANSNLAAPERTVTRERAAGGSIDNDPRQSDARPSDLRQSDPHQAQARPDEALEPLFTQNLAESYRARWTSIQSGFVDDPRHAVRNGDELVAEVITNLADTFAQERQRLETQLGETGESSTENLRVALQRYRSFFERLLSL